MLSIVVVVSLSPILRSFFVCPGRYGFDTTDVSLVYESRPEVQRAGLQL